jgi:hypothetical protein
MTRYEHSTFLARPAMKRGLPTSDRRASLAAPGSVAANRQIQIRGALVDLHCAVYRRREARR